MEQPDVRKSGWLLDGFPRTAGQAEAMKDGGIMPAKFILLKAPCTTHSIPCTTHAISCTMPCMALPVPCRACIPCIILRMPSPVPICACHPLLTIPYAISCTMSCMQPCSLPSISAWASHVCYQYQTQSEGDLNRSISQVSEGQLVERCVHRRIDPETNKIYHLKFKPPVS